MEIVKYLLVGTFCAALYVALANAAELIMPPMAATFAAHFINGWAGYFMQMRITFRAAPNHKRMLWKYIALTALMLGYGELMTAIGGAAGIGYKYISVFIALTIPVFSFPIQKLWVYKKRTNDA